MSNRKACGERKPGGPAAISSQAPARQGSRSEGADAVQHRADEHGGKGQCLKGEAEAEDGSNNRRAAGVVGAPVGTKVAKRPQGEAGDEQDEAGALQPPGRCRIAARPPSTPHSTSR